MQTYIESKLDAAKRTCDVVMDAMDQYWTPFEGHKVSLRSSVDKWNDFLFVAQSGQRTAASKEEELEFFKLECVVLSQLRDWQPA